MIQVKVKEHKGKYTVVAVADHQKDLNNLRLMSYSLFKKDKVTLNKDEWGGPYLKVDCDAYQNSDGSFNVEAIQNFAKELAQNYN